MTIQTNGKTIILMRHARAPMAMDVADKDRPLDSAGESQAIMIGRALSKTGAVPDMALCSPALRTRMTFNLVGQNWAELAAAPHEMPDGLYNASTGDIFAFIQSLPEHVKTVMIVAHNPGIAGMASMLWDGMDAALDDMLIMTFPPATTVMLRHDEDVDWRDMQPQSCRALHVVTP